MRPVRRAYFVFVLVSLAAAPAVAQPTHSLTWNEIRDRFLATNPTLQAGRLGLDEARADEVTAFLRPNPQFSVTLDQVGNTDAGNAFSASNLTTAISYLHEREHKRELRRESAEGATALAGSAQADLERTLIFTLRAAFVQALQAKAFSQLAQESLASYDALLTVSRDRLQTGDIAAIDLDRLELQRIAYESDAQTADINLRTAKIQLLRLLNDDSISVDQLDVSGPFDFSTPTKSLDELRGLAVVTRPDLRAAVQAVAKARTDSQLALANGSTDPTIAVDAGFPAVSQGFLSYQPPLRQYVGVTVGIPLRIFDHNQGEQLKTRLDIARQEQLATAAQMQVFGDVDTAYATVMSSVTLLHQYQDRYIDQATGVRDTVTFSYQRGGSSLVEVLQAQQEYRAVQVGYVNLIASFLNAVNQLNLAIGQEVIP